MPRGLSGICQGERKFVRARSEIFLPRHKKKRIYLYVLREDARAMRVPGTFSDSAWQKCSLTRASQALSRLSRRENYETEKLILFHSSWAEKKNHLMI